VDESLPEVAHADVASFEERDVVLLQTVPWGPRRLALGVVLAMYRNTGRAPGKRQVPADLVNWVGMELDIEPEALLSHSWSGRTHRRLVIAVRAHLGVRLASRAERVALQAWLCQRAWQVPRRADLQAAGTRWLRNRQLEVPTDQILQRWASSAQVQFEEQFDAQVVERLTPAATTGLSELLLPGEDDRCAFDELRTPTGRPTQRTLRAIVAKLRVLAELDLEPGHLFADASQGVLRALEARVRGDDPWQLRRYSPARSAARAALGACDLRARLTDDLVTAFLAVQARNWKKARKQVDEAAGSALPRRERDELLRFIVTDVLDEGPDGSYARLYERFGRAHLEGVRRALTTSPSDRAAVRARAACDRYRRVARSHLRLAVRALECEAGDPYDQHIIAGLDVAMSHFDRRAEYFPEGIDIPLGFVSGRWTKLVIEHTDDGGVRVRRDRYEVCVLTKLDQALRSRRIWVRHGRRFGDPEADLPQDWDETRDEHFAAYAQPADPGQFVTGVRGRLRDELLALARHIRGPKPVVSIVDGRSRPLWRVPALTPRLERPVLGVLKAAVSARIGRLDLSDALLEAHRQVDLTPFFQSSAQREVLTGDDKVKRLLLAVFGLGTNLGLKRIHSAARTDCTYRELRYFAKRFVSVRGLHEANAALTNRILEVRDPQVWPEGMKVASDGKHLAAWSGNTINDFNRHYAKYGVMAYWHIETNAVCLHVDLKSVGRSEVPAMVAGLVRHASEAQIETNAVDSNGQSELGFAITHLLGVDLRPRLKRIKYERLASPAAGFGLRVPELAPMLREPIRWALIEAQYDAMTRTVAGISRGTGPVDDLLRRFNRHNRAHPTHKAFLELGRALKTIFLCRYLRSVALRSEIQDSLNVAENWNSCVDFIFYGRQSVLSTNDPEQMQKSLGCLRLLQNALVLVNTLLLQDVLPGADAPVHPARQRPRHLRPQPRPPKRPASSLMARPRTPPKQMAAWLAEILQEEELDYQYVKEVFRHTRTLLAIGPRPEPTVARELLTPEEARRVFAAAGEAGQPRHRTMLRLQMLTGMRTGELIDVRVANLDLQQLTITLPADGARPERLVRVPELLRDELGYQHRRAVAAGEEHLFLSHHRAPYKARYVRRLFRKCGERAGLDKRVTADAMRLQLLVSMVREGIVGDDLLEEARARSLLTRRMLERLADHQRRQAIERAADRVTGSARLSLVTEK
jgi:TnpA family transposase/integrase